jgi:hypothetical protein
MHQIEYDPVDLTVVKFNQVCQAPIDFLAEHILVRGTRRVGTANRVTLPWENNPLAWANLDSSAPLG